MPTNPGKGSDEAPHITGPIPFRVMEDTKDPAASHKADNFYQQYLDGIANVARPGFNTTGREVELQLNAYPITSFPTLNVYQYDVSYSSIFIPYNKTREV